MVSILALMAGCAHLGGESSSLGGLDGSGNDLTVTLDKANREYQHGRLDLALQDYQELLSRVPNNALVLLQLGNIDYRVGNMDGARQMYQKSLESKPKQPEVQFNLAMVELGLAQRHLKTYSDMVDAVNPTVTRLMTAIDDFAAESAALTQQKSDASLKSALSPRDSQ